MCLSCELNAQVATLPARERLYVDDHWRVAHGWSSLPGWLVVVLRRHAEALDELRPEESASLGPILHAASAALRDAVGCVKTYVMLFTEMPQHHHVHLHVVPRMEWFESDDVGARVFRYLNVSEDRQVAVHERERLAGEIGQTMRALLT